MTPTTQRLLPTHLGYAKDLIRCWQRDDGVTDPILPDDSHLQEMLAKPDFHLFVALKEGEVVGGLSAYALDMLYRAEKEMFLYELGVDAAHRREGIARALIDALKAYCREQGIKEIFVGTEMDNEMAQQFYLATGGKMEVQPWFGYMVD